MSLGNRPEKGDVNTIPYFISTEIECIFLALTASMHFNCLTSRRFTLALYENKWWLQHWGGIRLMQWCSFEDAISSLLTRPYRPHPHLCVTDRLCREFDLGGMHPVSSRHPAQGVTHQICHQGSIFWSKCASFLIDFQDNDKINQAGQQGLLQGVHFKRHSKGNYLEWDFNWENCVQYFILTKSIKSVDTEKKRPPSEEASVKRS